MDKWKALIPKQKNLRPTAPRVLSVLVISAVLFSSFKPAAEIEAATCGTLSGNNVTFAVSCELPGNASYAYTGTLTINNGVTVTMQTNVGNGDISLGTADLVVNGTLTQSGTYDVIVGGTLTVSSGGTMNHTANSTTALGKQHHLSIEAANIDIQSGAIVNVDSRGFDPSNGPGAGSGATAGGGHGGYGGPTVGSPGDSYGSIPSPDTIGSGGSQAGSDGGGMIKLVTPGTLTINATISASSTNGAAGNTTSRGAGGTVYLSAGTLAGSGNIRADGGNNTSTFGSSNGASGAGGRIAIYYTTDSSTLLTGTKTRASGGDLGGSSGVRFGGAGTIFVKAASATNGYLLLDSSLNDGTTTFNTPIPTATYDNIYNRSLATLYIPAGNTLTLASGGTISDNGSGTSGFIRMGDSSSTLALPSTVSITRSVIYNTGVISGVSDLTLTNASIETTGTIPTFNSLTIGSGSVYRLGDNNTHVFGDLTINGSLYINSYVKPIIEADNLTIGTTGLINTDIGYDASAGPGAGGVGIGGTSGGGGHGGAGGVGTGTGGTGGTTYGSMTDPTDFGSGGGLANDPGAFPGGMGGGVIQIIVHDTFTHNGDIDADGYIGDSGFSGSATGGGAGGSVNIDVSEGTFAGTNAAAKIRAPGMYSIHGAGGCGGGGRVAVRYAVKTYVGTITAYGAGQPGSGYGTGASLPFNGYCVNANKGQNGTVYELDTSPNLDAVDPDSVIVGSGDLLVNIEGSSFIAASVVRVNGADVSTTYIDTENLTATIPASYLDEAAFLDITVFNPTPGSGFESGTVNFTVANPVPTLDAIDPDAADVGSGDVVISVEGTNFVEDSIVRWDDEEDLVTAFIDDQNLTATIPASLLTVAGYYDITVLTPGPGGGETAGIEFTVSNPTPTLISVDPDNAPALSGNVDIDVVGTGFVDGNSTVYFEGFALATAFVDDENLTATIDSSYLTGGGTFDITVVTTAPGGGTSNALDFDVTTTTPLLTSLNPDTADAGTLSVYLNVYGDDFNATSYVVFDGVDYPATFNDSSWLSVSINADELDTIGVYDVTVVNPGPGGGESDPLPFNVAAYVSPWTLGTTPNVETFWADATQAASGRIVAVGYTGTTNQRAMYSDDEGETWTVAPTPDSDDYAWNGVTYDGTGRIVAVGYNGNTNEGAVMYSDDNGETWAITASPDGELYTWQSVSYGEGLFVAVGNVNSSIGAAMYSSDGLSWTVADDPGSENSWQDVTFGEGLFVAIGNDYFSNAIMYSIDGINWQMPSMPFLFANMYTITYGNGRFVGLGESKVIYSEEGVNWEVGNHYSDTAWVESTFADGHFVAVGFNSENDTIAVSSDGINWYRSAPPIINSDWYGLTSGATRFVGVGSPPPTSYETQAMYMDHDDIIDNPTPVLDSIDPTTAPEDSPTFTLTLEGSDFMAESVVFFGGEQLDTTFIDSTTLEAEVLAEYIEDPGDYLVYVLSPGPGGGESDSLTFSVSDEPVVSPWQIGSTPDVDTTWTDVVSGGAAMVAVGAYDGPTANRAMYSMDAGATWALGATPDDQDYVWYSVAYDGSGRFVASGAFHDGFDYKGAIMYSDDSGANWTLATTPQTLYHHWRGITYGEGRYVAVGSFYDDVLFESGGAIMSSADGVNWSYETDPGAVADWRDVAYGAGRFVAVGNANTEAAMYSDDGETWTFGSTPFPNSDLRSVAFGGGNFVAVSQYTIFVSIDNGETWGLGNYPTDTDYSGIAYGDGYFVAVGSNDFDETIYISIDGWEWAQSNSPIEDANWYGVAAGPDSFAAVGWSNVNTTNAIHLDFDDFDPNPDPVLVSMDPDQNVAGAGFFYLTVHGSGFVDGSVVRWEGDDLVTNFIDSGTLVADVAPFRIENPGNFEVDVWSPGPGGGSSDDILIFEVLTDYPEPSITSLNPDEVEAGGPDFILTVTGEDFFPGSVVRLSGDDRPTTFVDDTELTAEIFAADIADSGTLDVTVFNPTPGGGETNQLTFEITEDAPTTTTSDNRVFLSREKAGSTADVLISFHMTVANDGGDTVVTFPAGFTILGAPTAEDSHPCYTAFAFDDTAKTVTATKGACGGDVDLYLGGFQVINPVTPGSYYISWVNDEEGGGATPVPIEDQINVTANVDPYVTFVLHASTVACDHGADGSVDDYAPTSGSTVAFGTLLPTAVASSDGSGSSGTNEHICTIVSTNAPSGYSISVRSLNGGLYNGSQYINSNATETPFTGTGLASQTASGGTERYGICLTSVAGEVNKDASLPAGFDLTASGNYGTGGNCTSSSASLVPLSQDTNTIGSNTGPVQDGTATWRLKASISSVTGAGNYNDTLTFVATATY